MIIRVYLCPPAKGATLFIEGTTGELRQLASELQYYGTHAAMRIAYLIISELKGMDQYG